MYNTILKDILQECGAVKFGAFTLVNDQKSGYYIDIKKATTKPKILKLICDRIITIIKDRAIPVDYIACIELGGIPIGTIISYETGLPLLIIRKEEKSHGIKERIIGDFEKQKFVLLVEDVTTTGKSIISAVRVLRNECLIVRTIITVVDRDEGAVKNLHKEGLNLISLINAKSLLENETYR